LTLLHIDGSLQIFDIKEHKLPTVFVKAGKCDFSRCFERLVKTNYRRKPFLVAAGDRYLVFGPLTTTLYAKIYLTVVQHLLATLAGSDDD
jgi:hypothetical protein